MYLFESEHWSVTVTKLVSLYVNIFVTILCISAYQLFLSHLYDFN